jgi:hypothetical protein
MKNISRLLTMLGITLSLVVTAPIYAQDTVNPKFRKLVEYIKENSKPGRCSPFGKTFPNGTGVRYFDYSKGSLKSDGEINKWDGIYIVVKNGDSFYEKDLDGFIEKNKDPNEIAIIFSDNNREAIYSWDGREKNLKDANPALMKTIDELNRYIDKSNREKETSLAKK